MASKVAQIIDAVVTQLNALSFTETFTATKTYNPQFDKKNSSTLQVQVSPVSYESENITRVQTKDTIAITIGIQKEIAIDTNTGDFNQAEVEGMMATVEEILNGIRGFDISSPVAAQQIGAVASPMFYPDHLYDYSIYTGIISLTYYTKGTIN